MTTGGPGQPDRGRGNEPSTFGTGPGWWRVWRPLMWAVAMAVAVAWLLSTTGAGDEDTVDLTYSEFITRVESGEVASVTIEGDAITGDFTEPTEWPVEGTDESAMFTGFETVFPEAVGDPELLDVLADGGVEVDTVSPEPSPWMTALVSVLPWLLIIGFFVWIARRASRTQQGLFSFGRSKARKTEEERPDIDFDDVAGQDQAKTELQQVVGFLRDPDRYHEIGARLPRGVLLVGPPGTGKTLLGRAVAGEASVPFFNLSATEFVEMFVGVGASRVRDLFEKAKSTAPSIVFIDELDAVGRRRGAGVGATNDEREQTLNQLLSEMDGFDERANVIILAATNRPDVLDPALLRPGRFDRQVTVGLPDREGRRHILEIHCRDLPLDDDVDLDTVAAATMGMSGADLANIANEAALLAAGHARPTVTAADFDDAVDKVILGGERKVPVSETERRTVAYHEAGHALTAWLTPQADPVRKITIVPHGQALGATAQLPAEDRVNYPKTHLLGRLQVLLGGRVAEEVALDDVTTGGEADLVQATRLTRRMVTRWGMGNLGPIAFSTDDEQPFLGYELATHREVGPETATRIDADVERIIEETHARVRSLLDSHREQLDKLVDALVREESLDTERIEELIGPSVTDDHPDRGFPAAATG